MLTVNKKVACRPFKSHSLKMEANRGLPSMKQKTELCTTEVVFDSKDDDFKIGDVVWFRGDVIAHTFSKEIYEYNGVEFILMPVETVLAIERPNANAFAGESTLKATILEKKVNF